MGKRHAVGAIVGMCLTAGLVAGCAPADSGSDASSTIANASAALSSTGTPTLASASLVAAPRPAGERVVVTRVIDGDTVEVTGRRTIRLLGIDSCESNTAAGRRATTDASNALLRRTVTLTAERGVNRDRYQRELRYITMPGGQDFGQMMVTKTHTAVYAGRNDASPAYIATLRRLDTNGRTCTDPKPAPKPAPKPTPSAPAVNYQNCAAAEAAGATPLYRGQPGYSSQLDRDNNGIACETLAPAPNPVPKPSTKPSPSAPAVTYQNCTAARAAGAAPLYRGQPGYSSQLDRDNDGIACE